MRLRRAICPVIIAAAAPAGCIPGNPDWIAVGRRAMVASDSAAASRIGADVLRRGGNAIDAAVAVSFALAVTRPQSTGLGGGGFLIYRRAADGAVFVQDFRETAPARADADMFVRARQTRADAAPPPSQIACLAVAVPGLVAGRLDAHARWGTRPLPELLAGAIRLARDGAPVDQSLLDACRAALQLYEQYPRLRDDCPYVWRTYLGQGRLPQLGDRVPTPALANLIEHISRHGRTGFYDGPVATALAATMHAGGGLIIADDLRHYAVRTREPLRTTYRDYEVISMPPPSSGGLCLLQTLNILEHFDLRAIRRDDPLQATHVETEALKHAFADRARWLADTDYVHVPMTRLLSREYAADRAAALSLQQTARHADYGLPQLPADAGTSHFSIIDADGNCVVSTETINTEFGSLVAVDDWGLILNNEMDDFAAEPGTANAFDLMQSQRNAPAAGKRPLSSMAPTIVLRDGRPVLLLGASGGPRIITSVLHVLLNVLDYDMTLHAAMNAPRAHHQWLPDVVYFDRDPGTEWTDGLRRYGHVLDDRRRTGIVQAIHISDGKIVGAADPRKGGIPSGY